MQGICDHKSSSKAELQNLQSTSTVPMKGNTVQYTWTSLHKITCHSSPHNDNQK